MKGKAISIVNRMTIQDTVILIAIICAALFGITQQKIIMYIPLAVYFIFLIARKIKRKVWVTLLLLNMITPDNYLIIPTCIVLFMFSCKRNDLNRQEKAFKYWISLFGIYLLFNIIITFKNFNNSLFYIIYNLPFFCCFLLFYNQSERGKMNNDNVDFFFKSFLMVEITAVIFFFFTHIHLIKASIDNDWVSGTLGQYHSDFLMIVSSFAFIYFMYKASFEKDKRYYCWGAAAIILALGTTSLTYTLSLAMAILICTLIDRKTRIKSKMLIFGILVIGAVLFSFLSPSWVTKQIPRLLDYSYFQYRVPKIKYYENVFINMPRKEGLFVSIIGTGAGLLCSRAAETCAGGYIGFYDRYFGTYTSYYRKEYILSVFCKIEETNEAKTSILGTARSSFMSIRGELGLIGIAFLIALIIYLYRDNKNLWGKVAVTYFVFLLFFDSFTEFAKMGVAFWITYYAIQSDYSIKSTYMIR